MGGVPYIINPSALVAFRENETGDNKEFTEAELDLVRLGILLYCDIGEIDIAVNREEVRYTPKTLMAIKTRLQEVLLELNGLIKKEIKQAKSRWETIHLFHFFCNKSQVFRTLQKARLAPAFYWKNKLIDSNLFYSKRLANENLAQGISIKKIRSYQKSIQLEDIPAFDKKPKIVIDDECKNKGQRLVLAKTKLDDFLFVRAVTPNLIKEFIKFTCLEDGEYQNLSDFEAATYESQASPKRRCNVFLYAPKGGVASESWSETAPDFNETSETAVYVEIYKYLPIINGKEITLNFLDKILSFLKEIGTPINQLYGIKSKHLNKIEKNSQFSPLIDALKMSGTKFLKNEKAYQTIIDREFNSRTLSSKLEIDFEGLSELSKSLSPSHDIVLYGEGCCRLAELQGVSDSEKIKKYLSIINHLELAKEIFNASPLVSLEAMADKILAKYPLLNIFSSRVFKGNHSSFIDNNYVMGKIRIKHLLDYISLIDKNK
jgi:hypothetical protein